ncbi:hypothetical protein, partial [Pseudomonas viridiflava]|uniref:hypothetical protein n=1 Tax=Pseudomonas viridiflava TaxID=33069 RepID=UPI00197D100E
LRVDHCETHQSRVSLERENNGAFQTRLVGSEVKHGQTIQSVFSHLGFFDAILITACHGLSFELPYP